MNSKLLMAAFNQIVKDPKHWNQKMFASRADNECGTAFCLAGHVLILMGYGIQPNPRRMTRDDGDDFDFTRPYSHHIVEYPLVDARKLTGLSEEQAMNLFIRSWEITDPAELLELMRSEGVETEE